ncbi:MAG: hypothetical protein LBI18_03745 [Planctomycetaceae bacterium]|jgi:hypothetical protein|nr:hypothetical protein [Planctomycetaceae bacterium]
MTKNFYFLIFILFVSSISVVSAQTVVKEVVRFEQMNKNLLQSDQFRPYESGFEKQDAVFICNNGSDLTARRGVFYNIVLNQEQPRPIYAEAWSKAENVSGFQNSDYSIYLDLTYNDGTSLWAQCVSFSTGTHDWERKHFFVIPEKPVKSLAFYMMFRNKTGKVWFRDAKLSVQKINDETVLFDGVPIRKPKSTKIQQDTISFQIRNVADDSDFILLEQNSFGIHSKIESNETTTQIVLTNETNEDRCLTLIFSRFLNDLKNVQFCQIRKNIPTSNTLTCEHTNPVTMFGMNHIKANCCLAKYPLSAVVGQKDGKNMGYALGIDLTYPAFFRTGYNEATNELFVAVDLALTKESPEMMLRFLQFGFAAESGFRGALDAYHHYFPDFFRTKIKKQGLWMPFVKISEIPQFEDFGFAFKEGINEIAWDDTHDILTFRYTEPVTWWMPLPKEMLRTYEVALKHAQKLADNGNTKAKTLFITGMRDVDGNLGHHLWDTPWCDGAVWSFNDLPGITNGGFSTKWNEKIAEEFYGNEVVKKAVLDGEYVDTSEGFAAAILDFDRNHFSAAKRPLVFSRNDYRPAIFRGLIIYEYVRTLAEYLHARNKFVMANGTPDTLCWLVPYLDVSGTETNWNRDGKWTPMSIEELFYRRALCGQKPYCFLMNSDFTKWTYELTEKYMKRSLAFGMFPSFFSADASSEQYFTRPELYERDRPLFKKYIPLCKEVAEAGWQPITKVVSSNDQVFVERFGNENMVLTVFNDSSNLQTVTLHFDAGLPKHWNSPLDDKKYETKNNMLIFNIAPEDIIVLKSDN